MIKCIPHKRHYYSSSYFERREPHEKGKPKERGDDDPVSLYGGLQRLLLTKLLFYVETLLPAVVLKKDEHELYWALLSTMAPIEKMS